MTVPALLAELRTRDIQVWADGDRLQCNAPASVLTPELREQLRQRKKEILEFLRGPAELSFSQQRLWILDQIAPGGGAYIIAGALELRGALDAPVLERALEALVNRHESLRTVFVNAEGEPLQVVSEAGPWVLPVVELSAETYPRERLEGLLREEASRGFDLARGPLFRAQLYRLSPDTHVLLLAMHHIVSDGWSIGILFRELSELYGGFARGEAPTLPVLRVQYRDFARWQRSWLEGEALEGLLSHWRERLAGAPQVLELPTDRPRPAVESFRGALYSFSLPLELVEGLRALARREGATLFMTLLSGFSLLLARYSSQQDVLIGSPVANRNRAEIEGLVGFFVNTLVLRADLSGEPSVREFLGRMREVCLDAYAHQDLPFDRLVEELQPARDPSRNAVFQVMFALQNAPMGALELPGLTLRPVEVDAGAAQVDLTLMAQETPEGLSGVISYATDLFDASTVARMAAHWRALLEAMVATPERRISELPLLTEAERHQVVVGWNATARDYGVEARLHRLIEAQAARTPEAVALEFEGRELSYAQVNARANQLARVLQKRGVGPEVLVGVLAERSFEMVVALLAVLKAGGAYVPLDPSYPAERLGHVLEDARAPLVLAQPELVKRLPAAAGEVLLLDASWAAYAGESGEDLEDVGTPEDLAYVIFTSGSTGRPKGAMNAHRGIVNRLLWMQEEYGLGGDDRVLQKTPFSFDVSVWEFFWPLLTGARLVIARPEGHKDPGYLVKLIQDTGVTTLHFVPSMLRVFLEEAGVEACGSLKRVICSGEALPHELQERFFARLPGVELHNLYGPTEAAVDVTYWACRRGDERLTVPIGRPVANTQMYVLDQRLAPVPIGVAGELYIGGVQVGRGYVGRDDLTAERFVPDPFSRTPGARLYKTGDLARHLSDGAIEYLGRLDYQVKIRGQRIELGEIEATLDKHPGVGQSVVLAREDTPGDQRLVAYVVPRQAAPTSGQLKEYLSRTLPPYMVLDVFVFLEALLLTSSGKVDRKALPVPERSGAEEVTYVAPRTATEEILAGVWAEVLGLERLGINDNFFDLGGHSLLATQVVSRVRRALGMELPLRELFAAPTVSCLSARIETLRAEPQSALMAPPLEAMAQPGPAELSFSQQRLWILDQIAPGGGAYIIAGALELRGALDAPVLERALGALVNRHESLRTVFVNVEGQPLQVVAEPGEWTLPVADLSAEANKDQRLSELLREEAACGFDLARGPLFRAQLYRLAADTHVLLVAMHHIVSDGWSIGILFRELGALYGTFARGEAPTLPVLRVQYRDFARWQRSWLEGEVLEGLLSHWRERLAGAPQVLELPTDRPRPAVESFRGALYSFTLSLELTEALRALSRREGATLFMTLLSGFSLLLARYSGQQDLLVGTPVANRNRAEIEDLIGFFVNTLVLRADMSGEPSVREFLGRMREVCLDAYARQDLPFDRLVEELQPAHDLGRNPVFQVMFALQNAPMGALELPGLTLRPVEVDAGAAQVDLTLMAQETPEGLSGVISYATDLFDEPTIARMAAHWRALLGAMAATPERRISELPLLTEAERHQVVVGWNATARDYGVEARLHRLIEAQAARTPEAVALEFEGRELSYAQVNARANQLARVLQKRGVGPEVLVGVLAERSFEMVVALLAVLKAGGAYVPLDPSYPAERLGHVLEDARAPLVLAQPELAGELPASAAEVLVLDASWAAYASESGGNLQDVGTPEDLAYVIFTSGSTGRPKGAMNAHRGIVNRLLWMQEEYGLGGDDRVLQKTPFSFDVSVWEFFWPLLTGARLVIARPEGHKDSAYLAWLIRESRITTLHFVPSMLRVFLEEAGVEACGSLKRVICSGEALPHELQERFFARLPAVELHNLYGPTEAAVDVTYWACRRGDERLTVPIGRPVANTQMYVLDRHLQPVPVGVPGELYIGGVQVGRGYIGRPELTAERFVPDPFSRTPGARLYKTGDLARHLSDGAIEYLGRLDYQVKIRGQRIELGEIEATLDKHPGVGQSVVLAREDTPGDQRLVAYVVPRQAAPTSGQLKEYLSRTLPPYMVPDVFVFLEALLLTSSGKVDRKALPVPERSGAEEVTYVAPRTATEEILAGVWAEVLGLERLGINDNFFDLGGHSLMAARLMHRLRIVSGVQLPLRNLFERPTVAGLAEMIDGLSWLARPKAPAHVAADREEIEL